MQWQIKFLIILSLLSAQTHSHMCVRKLKSRILTFHQNVEVYNRPFSMEELQNALRRAHDTSAGPDEIHYQRLKHLPKSSLLLLLNIINKI